MNKKAKVLIVDDDPNLRKTLSDILRVKGFESAAVGSGAEAITMSQEEKFSVCLMDLNLPDMSGLDVMDRIKELSPLTETIILTGHASMDTAIEATRRGAFSYLLKPYQVEDLLLNIQHGVERQQAQEEIHRLASYPRLNPDPVIEIAPTGEVTYVNPAAEKQFPDISTLGLSHPMLYGVDKLFDVLRQNSHEISREIWIGRSAYEQHISYIPENDLIRIYVLDVTKRKQAESELEIREREQAAVAALGTQALAGLDLASVYDKAISLITRTLGVGQCMILELQPGKDALLLRAGAGWDKDLYGKAMIEVSTGSWADVAMASEEPICFKDRKSEVRVEFPPLLDQYGIVSGITTPIGPAGNPLGILGVFSADHREFNEEDGRFLQAIANVIAAAEGRLHAEEEIHILASTDSLTGIANRREFTSVLEKEMARAKRYGSALSLIMYDIDHFKRVNDTLGHDVGDEVLKTLTMLVKKVIRSADILARWGGEEFLILSPESDMDAAKIEAERLRQAIADYPFKKVGKITVSFGVTSFDSHDDMTSLLKRVDDALYKAKENGRNRVEVLSFETVGMNHG